MRKLLVGLGVFVGAISALAVWVIFVSGPSIRLTLADEAFHIDTRFLGEYCSGLSEVSLAAQSTGEALWTLRPVKPPYMGFCQFTLAPGENPVVPPRAEALPVIPRGAATFSLSADTSYTLSVCGNNGFGRDRCSRAAIDFH